jgi:hypothetical protein
MAAHSPSFVRWAALLPVGALTLSLACGSPTSPDTRTGYIALRVLCDGSGAAPLRCLAETYCSGSHRCPDPQADGRDVTLAADWSSANGSIARLVSPGTFDGVGPGNTVIYASMAGVSVQAAQTVAVFDGAAPLPTNEIFGSVWEAGRTIATGALNGAVVEVLNGHVAGRTASSGVPPPLLPGFFGPFGGPGYYRVLGVPPGTYTLRATAAGYVSQDRTVTVPARGSPSADFQMARP